jgi:predicted acetyltransferase
VPIDIRPIEPSQLRAWLEAVETSFADEVRDERFSDFERVIETERVLGAYDGDELVGGGAAYTFRLTVPGGESVAAAGVTAIGVKPTHRRQGMLRSLMTRQLADVRARGEPLAILWASEGSIYQRFGYGLATVEASFEIERERTGFRRPWTASSRIRLVSRDEAMELFSPVYDNVAARTPGFFARNVAWWRYQTLSDYPFSRNGASAAYHVIAERDKRVVGYARYRVKPDWTPAGPNNVLAVNELLGIDPAAEQDLWRFVFDVDLMARISVRFGPPRHPLLLLLAEPRRLRLSLRDGLWLRIVDVPAALEGRRYEADGKLVLEVSDEFMPAAGGRFELSVRGGKASVRPTDAAPELELDTTDLAASYLGAFTFGDLAAAGRTREIVAGARARAASVFATSTVAWCPEVF